MASVICDLKVDLANDVVNHLLGQLNQIEADNEPFSHFYVTNVFPDEIYRELLQRLPVPEAYQALDLGRHRDKNGASTRNFLELSEAGLLCLSESDREFWRAIATALRSPRLKAAVFHKLRCDLGYRFQRPPETAAQIPAWPKSALFRDLAGYEIPPHPDGRKKIVTMQLYLPPDESQLHLGTALYQRRLTSLSGLVSWKGRFEKVRQFPFAPNSGYAFVVNNTLRKKSWHGRERIPDGAAARNSLLNIYYASERAGY